MTIWTENWLKVAVAADGDDIEVLSLSDEDRKETAYLKISDWDPVSQVLQATLNVRDDDRHGWSSVPFPLHYISGTNLDFLCWAQVTGDNGVIYAITARVRGTLKGGVLRSATFTTVGGYYVQTLRSNESSDEDDEDSDHEHQGGQLKIKGKLISKTRIPRDLRSY